MKRSQLVVGLAILLGAIVLVVLLVITRPQAEQKAAEKSVPVVEVYPVKLTEVALELPSQGVVEPEKETLLAAEVSGKVQWVAPQFKAGGEFDEGAEMVRVDPSDFETRLFQAKASLAEAKLDLRTEEAKRDQALRDWEALGKGGEPSDLVTRKPQLARAKSNLEAAEANVSQAERDLERSHIKAPYGLRVEEINTEVGSYLTTGASVAQVFALSPLEVRLPLSLDDYAFVGSDKEGGMPKAELKAEIAGTEYTWQGKIVRSEGQVDRSSRSVYLVAQVTPKSSDSILQPGLFVKAMVQGRTLDGVAQIPLSAFLDFDRVVMVNSDNKLEFRKVKVLRRQGDEAIVGEGLKQGDRICLTALDSVVEGMEVEVKSDEEEVEKTSPEEGEDPAKPKT